LPLEPGSLLSNKYEIKKLLGKGTITEVYLAHQKALSKDVVIKVLSTRIAADRDLLRRFVSEVEAVAALEAHPNVAWVLDLDKDGRWIYYVMDFYPYSLKQMLTEAGKLTPEDTVRVTSQILQALRFAHSNGILHRDIKPQNIMFKEDGVAVLTDFGIGELAREAVQKLKITQLLPSPAYLAPEHIRNPKAVDTRADIYALGAVMYEMLTGQVPFKGDIKTVYSMKFLGRFTPIQEAAPGVPEELAKIAEKAMATDPRKRYSSADEFLSEFEESGEEVFYLAKALVCDMDLPLVRRARMTLSLEIRDDAILEIRGMRYPLVVSPSAVFPVEVTLSGHGEFQCVLRARSKDFTVIDGPFRDISLGREETQKALWQVRAPDGNSVGEFELQVYRGGQSVLREPVRFRAMSAVYARVEEKKKR